MYRSPMIFICYANDDKKSVDDIYLMMKSEGLNPWMDKPPDPYKSDGIKPGERWDNVIREKIKIADYFLAFLSKVSVSKRGYVHREYRMALDTMNEMPADDIFVIPVLLQKCEPPNLVIQNIRFSEIQHYNYYEDGIEPLLTHLKNLSKEKFEKSIYFGLLQQETINIAFKSDSDKKEDFHSKAIRKDIEYLTKKYTDLQRFVSGWIYVGNYDYEEHCWVKNTYGYSSIFINIQKTHPNELIGQVFEIDRDVNMRARPTISSEIKTIKRKSSNVTVVAIAEIQHVIASRRITWAGLIN